MAKLTPVERELTSKQLERFRAGVKKVLAAKPSELIRIALKDLEWAEKSPKYAIDMGHWHTPDSSGMCYVCLAGSVMAGTMKIPRTVSVYDAYDVDGISVNRRLDGLDDLRIGSVACFLVSCGVRKKVIDAYLSEYYAHEFPIHNYYKDSKQFKADMRRIAKQLEKHGL